MYNAQQRRAMMNPNGGGVGACGGGPYGAGGGAGQMFRGFAPGVARPAAAPVAPAYASGMNRVLAIPTSGPHSSPGSAATRALILANWSNIPVLQAVWFLLMNADATSGAVPIAFVPDTLSLPNGSIGQALPGEPSNWTQDPNFLYPKTPFWSQVAREIENRLQALGATYPMSKLPSDVVGAP